MMGLYIKGIEMPIKKNGAVLIIYPNGKCAFEDGSEYQAVPVPPHGRLIDADALMLHILDYIEEYADDLDDNGYHNGKWCAMKEAEMVINDAPTIIEAEEGE